MAQFQIPKENQQQEMHKKMRLIITQKASYYAFEENSFGALQMANLTGKGCRTLADFLSQSRKYFVGVKSG